MTPGDVWIALERARDLLAGQFDAALRAEVGLTLVEHDLLVQLTTTDGIQQMGDVARTLVLSKSGVTRLVTKLESEGLIERVTFPQDLRATFAKLTPAGDAMVRRSVPVLHRILDENFAAHLTPTELRTLSKTLQKVLDAHGWAPAQPCADWAHRVAGAPSAN